MQSSTDDKTIPFILADGEQEHQEDDNQQHPDQHTETEQEQVVYVYRTSEGGMVLSPTKIGDQEQEQEQEPPVTIIESQEPETDTRPTQRKAPPYVLYFLLMLLFFVGLDNVDTFFTLLTPTVTVTITPQVQTISTQATLTTGRAGADIHGRSVAPLTLSQTQIVTATGKGHQDAQVATGTLTFYNGLFASQTIDAGTVYTGSDGVQVATDQTVTIPPANPPYVGQVTVTAHASIAGASGNIQDGDISSTGNTLQVKNSQFSGGQNARDFIYVRKADIQGVVSTLTPNLLQSEQAALTAQLSAQEAIVTPACTPRTTANHSSGDEAQTVMVTVSETCSSLAYNPQELHHTAVTILTAHHAASLRHFQHVGDMHLSILSQIVNGQNAALTLQLDSTWVYQLNQQQIQSLITGKPRLDVLHLIRALPGVKWVSITGVTDNEALPTDTAHIHLSIVYFLP